MSEQSFSSHPRKFSQEEKRQMEDELLAFEAKELAAVDPGRYASNDFDSYQPPNCERCGHPAKVAFCLDTTWGDPVDMYRPGRHWCETPNCVDSRGYNVVMGTGMRRE